MDTQRLQPLGRRRQGSNSSFFLRVSSLEDSSTSHGRKLDGADASRWDFAPADLLAIVAGQARLVAARAESGLPLDARSVVNLMRALDAVLVNEGAA